MGKMMETAMATMERRTIRTKINFRAADNGQGNLLEGYALKFNTKSEDMGGFDETLATGCLDGADMLNVVALYNHDPSYPLGRNTVTSGPGSLALAVDNVGLKFSLQPTDTGYVSDLIKNIQAGVVSQCSFAFTLPDDGSGYDLDYDGDADMWHRTITHIARLWDVSIVTTPAYPDTDVSAAQRDIKRFKAELQKAAMDQRKRRLAIELELSS